MKSTFPRNRTALLVLSVCALLAACESKDEKHERVQKEEAAAEKKKLDGLFAGAKSAPVVLNENAMAQLRAMAPAQSVTFADETVEVTAAGEGAVSACAKEVDEQIRREHCYGKTLIAQGSVGSIRTAEFGLDIKGVTLEVGLPQGGIALSSNDQVMVRGTAAESSMNGYIALKDATIEKVPVALNPDQTHFANAIKLASLCYADSGTQQNLSVAGGKVPSSVADVVLKKGDTGSGFVTILDLARKIDGSFVSHIKRCAIENGTVAGKQVRAGEIVDGKVVFADASGQWESEKVLEARLAKADSARRHAEREADLARKKDNELAEQDIRKTLGRINRAPESMERTLAAADCLMALDKAERSVANWEDAKIYCRAKAQGVPGI
jgi:hypothetical protein